MTSAKPFRDQFALHVVLIWLAGCGFLTLISLERLRAGLPAGPDDTLRMVQIRDLLAGQNWFDPVQYRIDPPGGVAMHWSRLVDLPVAAIILLFAPLVGQAHAEYIALLAAPLLTFGVLVAAIAWLGQRTLDRPTALIACFIAVLAFPLAFQLSPMRIDHHGWQAVCFALALAALAAQRATRGGAAAGIACAAGMLVSLELLPLAAAIGGVLFLRRWRNPQQARWLTAYLQGLAGGTLLLYLATRGLAFGGTYCDAIGPAHIAFFLVLALGTALADRIVSSSKIGDLAVLAVTGAAALLAFGAAAPHCLASPFASLEPLAREYWYLRVPEGMPVWEQTVSRTVPMLVHLALGFGAAVAIALRARGMPAGGLRAGGLHSGGHERTWWLDYLLLFLAASILGLFVWRARAFAAVMGLLPLAWLVRRAFAAFRRSRSGTVRFGAAAALLLVIQPRAPMAAVQAALPAQQHPTAQVDGRASCETRRGLVALDTMPPALIFAQLDLGPDILLNTGHAVIATGHHRAGPAIAEVIRTFLGSPEAARQLLAERGVKYVMLCAELYEIAIYREAAPAGFAAQLVDGNAPAWLEPVEHSGGKALRIWRVR